MRWAHIAHPIAAATQACSKQAAHARRLLTLPQRIKQPLQAVVIEFERQREQVSEIARGEAFARVPCQVGARQVGDEATLVLAIGHGHGDQSLQVFRLHGADCRKRSARVVNSCFVTFTMPSPTFKSRAARVRFGVEADFFGRRD